MPVACEGFDRPALAGMLAEASVELELNLSTTQRDQLLDYVFLLCKWNAVYNLTAIRAPEEMLSRHVLDSLAVVGLVRRLGPKTLLDVGSGAGLPGIPIAIALPDVTVTLVDAVRKKVAFQLQVRGELQLAIDPIHTRVEALTFRKTFDCVISRAFSNLNALVDSSAQRAAPRGVLVAMKADAPTAEMEDLRGDWRVREVVNLKVPTLDARRCAVILERTSHARPS